jgi:outer membrane receptor protein involved in Fe transport
MTFTTRERDGYRRVPRIGGPLLAIALAPTAALAQSPGAQPPGTAPAAPISNPATPPDLESTLVPAPAAEPASTAPSDARSAVPITVLDREMLEATGTASLGHALQQLSWQSNSINGQFNNGGDGSTRIGLRGLTAQRTLVLINGRRSVQGGTGADSSVDLEAIPLALVERVEIVRGPAVRHGPGALGGVVNIVTRQDLDGVEASLFTGSTQDGLGVTYDASAALGQRFDRGRVVVAAGFHDQGAIGAGDREFSRNDVFYDWETGEVFTSGSTSTPQGYIRVPTGPDGNPDLTGNEFWRQVVTANQGASALTLDSSARQWRAFNSSGNADAGEGDLYNYQPSNHLVTPLQRFHVFGAGEYQLGDLARAFFEASYVNRRSEQQLAPTPFNTASSGIVVSADNVYNPFGRDFDDVRRRVVEAGNRRSEQDIDTLRLVAGLAGTLDLGLPSSWRWEASYGYGTTSSTERRLGDLRTDRLAAALGPSFIDGSGVARCGTADNPGDPDCVPFDIFGGAGAIKREMLGYVGHTGTNLGTNEQHVIAAGAGGDVVRTPSGAGLAVQAGAEFRQDAGSVTPDPLSSAGDTTGNVQSPFEGSVEVASLHAELTATPYVDAAAGHALELNAAARSFEHSASGSGMTWQLGAVLQLAGSLALRGSQARNLGSPTLKQLFSPGQEGFPFASDPCDTSSGRTPEAEANCSADGVPGNFVDDRRQLPARTGGNPDLQAETADILSAGVVFAPAFAPGLSASADYFQISVTDTAASLGAQAILQNCYNQAPGQRSDCDRIVRDPATGVIEIINDSLVNRGGIETAGVDVQLAYDSNTTFGRVRYLVGGVWLQKYEEILADGSTHLGTGVYDLGVHPRWRFNATALWDMDAWGAGANLRYIGRFRECFDNDCKLGTNPDGSDRRPEDPQDRPISRDVGAYVTADLYGSYTLESSLGQTRIIVGVRNAFDREPAVLYNGFLGTSDAATYDFAGRFVYARLVQQF